METRGLGAAPVEKGSTGLENASTVRKDTYKQTGVDTTEADAGLVSMVRLMETTWPKDGDERGRPLLPMGPDGYFANVIPFAADKGVAVCTDGVGSKSIIAVMIDKYDTIGIDCVAMNVNDMICVGAEPLTMVDYVAVQKADAAMLAQIGIGLSEGAKEARISISGGETAQLKDIVHGFDLVGMAVGRVDLNRIITGKEVIPGDIVVGVKSNGVHSNGLTLARRAFFEQGKFRPTHKFDELDLSIGEELLRPTQIYVQEAMEILKTITGLKALINITSDGLLNLARVAADVGFVIDELIQPHPVFDLIQRYAKVPDAEMYEVFNMGIGFCYVVSPDAVEPTLAILRRHGREARPIGHVTADTKKTVHIPERGLEGRHKSFWSSGKKARRFA